MRHWLLCILACGGLAGGAQAAAPARELGFSISVRTPEQVTAFYSARGFPDQAVRALVNSCLLTVGMHNNRPDVVWLELANWRFTDAQGREVRRITRRDWEARWEQLQVPPASRATFGWTQLPESRDLQPGEPVGGNVAVLPPTGPFTLEARFRTGQRKDGPVLRVHIPDLRCPAPGTEENRA